MKFLFPEVLKIWWNKNAAINLKQKCFWSENSNLCYCTLNWISPKKDINYKVFVLLFFHRYFIKIGFFYESLIAHVSIHFNCNEIFSRHQSCGIFNDFNNDISPEKIGLIYSKPLTSFSLFLVPSTIHFLCH